MGFRSQFRGTQEWLQSTKDSIKLSTTSDEAAKMYDATVTQSCGWYDDQSLGGICGSLDRMLQADPQFLLGRALNLQMKLMGGMQTSRLDRSLAKEIADLNKLAQSKKDSASEHELLHIDVVNKWAASDLKGASKTLERILTLYPEDVMALKMNQDTYFMLGTALPMRNSLACSLNQMSDKNPLKGYAHGMFAFALEESNMFPAAQREALKALSLIPRDTWAIHNYAHTLEMQAQASEGFDWIHGKIADWGPCNMLACHQYWHMALFLINKGQFEAAVDMFDAEVLTRCDKNSTSLDLHDVASMLYRMELVDLFGKTNKKKDDRWRRVYDVCKDHERDHLLGFNDAHYMMSFLGMGDLKTAQQLIESIDEIETLNEGKTVVKPLLEAMYLYKVEDYTKCADILEGIRFEIIKIGGSHAQRDIFDQLLLVAALRSKKAEHNKLAQRMLHERDQIHGTRMPQTQLLAEASS